LAAKSSRHNTDPDGLDEQSAASGGDKAVPAPTGEDPVTARRLQYLAKVSGGAYFRFDPRTQEQQFSEMCEAISAYATGVEEGMNSTGRQAATLVLEHLKQKPMPIVVAEERERVRIKK